MLLEQTIYSRGIFQKNRPRFIIKRIWTIIRFVSMLYVSTVLIRLPLYCQTVQRPISVAINKDDIVMLGGWPLERRWYGLAIQQLQDVGAKRIFIDIAFPAADILHPESDDFFFQQLEQMPEVYLLYDDVQNVATRNIVFGTKYFDTIRFVAPFSGGFSIKGSYLKFVQGGRTITDLFLPHDFSQAEILVELPSSRMLPDFTLKHVLQKRIDCQGSDVVIYLDYPGVTSYIVGSNSEVFSTASLQLWAIENIYSGNYISYPPHWAYVLAILFILLPIGIRIFSSRFAFWMEILSAVLWIGTALVMIIGKIHFTDWWYFALVPSVSFLIRRFFVWLKMQGLLRHAEKQELLSVGESQNDEVTIKELQHRLEYYERLSNQIPTSEMEEGFELHGIYYHKNSPMMDILRKAESVAKRDIPVLIRGESGTGKEMLAQYIHRYSDRRDRPIIAVNCGALNDNLIEAELFGYEKGAFTGAHQQKAGRFELAHGGTLFLDEVSETSLSFQVKLLRVLQEGVIERVGGTKPIPVSVRIIAATHQDLIKAIQKKNFREDLFYRLNGYEFLIPPLRERSMDVEYLFKHFLFEIDQRLKFSEPLIEWLKTQPWPGNIRQLKTTTQRAVINAHLRKRSFLVPKDFELSDIKNDHQVLGERLAEQILEKLRHYEFHHRSISAVASDLMVHRSTVTEYLRGWSIKYLNEGAWDKESALTLLRGTARISDEERLKKRIDEYIGYIESRIDAGLQNQEADEQILSTKFRNLPAVFKNDLIALIQKKRLLVGNNKNA